MVLLGKIVWERFEICLGNILKIMKQYSVKSTKLQNNVIHNVVPGRGKMLIFDLRFLLVKAKSAVLQNLISK